MDYEIIYAVVGDGIWEGYYEIEFAYRLFKNKENAEKIVEELNKKYKEAYNEFNNNRKRELLNTYSDEIRYLINKKNESIGDVDYPPTEWKVKEIKLYK